MAGYETSGRRALLWGAGLLAILAFAWWLATAGGRREQDVARIAGETAVTPEATFASELDERPAPALPGGLPAAEPERLVGPAGAAAPEPAAAAAASRVVLTGRVLDESGRPLEGVAVRYLPPREVARAAGCYEPMSAFDIDWTAVPATATAADGRFAFAAADVPAPALRHLLTGEAGAGNLILTHPGYAAHAPYCPRPKAGLCDVGDIELAPGTGAHGRVVDEQGRAVAGALVGPGLTAIGGMLIRGGDWGLARQLVRDVTGPNGGFALDGLWAGVSIPCQILHEDYLPAGFVATAGAGGAHDAGVVRLVRGARLAGAVVDEAGAPVAGAVVLVRATGAAGSAAEDGDAELGEFAWTVGGASGAHDVRVRTDDDGRFVAGTLGAKSYRVLAVAPGFEPAGRRDVPAGSDDLLLVLPRAGSILLRVVDADGDEPARGATAKARRRSGIASSQGAKLSLDATLEVREGLQVAQALGLPGDGAGLLLVDQPGRLRTDVLVSAPGFAPVALELPGVAPPARLERVVELVRETVVTGRVLDAGGAPIAGALVRLAPAGDTSGKAPALEARAATSDDEGRWRLGGLAAGEWTLRASADGYVESAPRPLVLPEAAAFEDADLVLERGATLRIVVVGRDGAPAEYASVLVNVARGASAMQKVAGADGLVELRGLPAGEASAVAPPGDNEAFVLRAGETTEATLVRRSLPRVSGRVLLGGAPVAGAIVEARFSPDGRRLVSDIETVASAGGDYALELDRPGLYVLVASGPGAGDRRVHGEPAALRVDFDARELLDLRLGAGQVEGVVVEAATGEPVPRARVSLRAVRLPGLSSELELADPLWIFDVADAEGRFTIDGVAAGEFALAAQAPGFGRAERAPVHVAPGQRVEGLRLELGPGQVLQGTVRMLSAAALPSDLRIGIERAGGDAQNFVTEVRPDGSWRVDSGFDPGAYVLTLFRQPRIVGIPADRVVLATREVLLDAGETEVVDFTIEG